MAFKFRAASGDLSGSPSAREGPAPTIGIRSIVSLYPRIGSGGLVGPSVPGVPGRVVTFTDFKTWPNSMPNTTHPSHPRQWYSRAPGGPNYQHRSEFCFSLALAENPQVEHQASSPRSSPRRRESDPSPQPGLGMYKRTLRDPAQVAGNLNSKIKFGVHQRLAESAPLIAGASKAVPLLYLHACSGCNGEARRSRSRAHPGSGPVTDPGPSIFHKFSPPPAGLLRKRWTFNLAEK